MYANGTPNSHFLIPTEKPQVAMVHDMFLTKKYAIVIDESMRVDSARIIRGEGLTYFDKTKKLRFGLLPRSNPSPENIVWVTTDSPGHVWHTISAWDNEDGVCIFQINISYRKKIM